MKAEGKVAEKFDENFLHEIGQHERLIKALRSGKDCVVIEIAYCAETERQKIVREIQQAVPNVKIKWICFENDLEMANKRCRERKNKGDPKGHIEINQRVSQRYKFPEGAEIRPIWTEGGRTA